MSEQENKLSDLPTNFTDLEKTAKDYNSLDLEDNLKKIRDVLNNNPNQLEIESAKSFINSLKELKNIYKTQTESSTKIELWNLSSEVNLFQEIQSTLDSIKNNNTQINKPQEGLNIREMIESNWWKSKYEHLFVGVKNETIKKAKIDFAVKIDLELSKYKEITNEQKENICIWIISKMLTEWDFDGMVGWLGDFMNWVSDNVKVWDWEKVSDTFENIPKSMSSKDIDEKVKQKIDARLKPIITQFDTIKDFKNPLIQKFLKNPKEIADYKWWPIPAVWEIGKEELIDFISKWNDKIVGLSNKFDWMKWLKDTILEAGVSIPFFADALIGLVKWLMESDFWKMIAQWILWIEWDDIVGWLKKDLERRKSCKSLRSFGLEFDNDWKSKESQNDPSIAILKNKDLREVKLDKMEKFFDYVQENKLDDKKIDISKKGFWIDLFDWNFALKNWTKIPGIKLKDSMFDTQDNIQKPNEDFYKYFNNIWNTQKEETPTQQQTIQQNYWSEIPTQAPQIEKPVEKKDDNNKPLVIVPINWEDKSKIEEAPLVQTPKEPEKKDEKLPKKISYEWSWNLIIDNKKYNLKLEVETFLPTNIDMTKNIKSIEYENWTVKLIIDWADEPHFIDKERLVSINEKLLNNKKTPVIEPFETKKKQKGNFIFTAV